MKLIIARIICMVAIVSPLFIGLLEMCREIGFIYTSVIIVVLGILIWAFYVAFSDSPYKKGGAK